MFLFLVKIQNLPILLLPVVLYFAGPEFLQSIVRHTQLCSLEISIESINPKIS